MTQMDFSDFDDIRPLSKVLPDPGGPSVISIMRNESFMISAFLDHYRKLGVKRFVVLDDQSNDGTRDNLDKEPDVMVLISNRRYSDTVDIAPVKGGKPKNWRMVHVWRSILARRFSARSWAVMLDADEFIHLPPGMRLQDVTAKADREGAAMIWGVMLDVYPKDPDALLRMGHEPFNPEGDWYFDGVPHLRLRHRFHPVNIYGGARHRLLTEFSIIPKKKQSGLRSFLSRLGVGPAIYLAQHKPVIIRPDAGTRFSSSHKVNLIGSPHMLLPIAHYKFAGDLNSRIESAITEGSHANNSRAYHELAALIARMRSVNAPFLCPISTPVGEFRNFARTGNALGFQEA